MSQVVDVYLRKLSVKENGEAPKREAANLLTGDTWPEETAKTPGIKVLRLRDDETIDFSKNDRLTKEPFTKEQIFLLRRHLVAPVALNLTLATVDEVAPVEKFLAKVFKGAFKAAWTTLSTGIGNVLGAAIAGSAASFHLESMEAKEQVFVIGKGSLEIDPDSLPSGPVKVPLFVSKKVVRTVASFGGPNDSVRREVTVLEPDSKRPNATVVLEIKAY